MTEAPLRKKPSGLGRGLSALLGEVAHEAPIEGGPARSGIQMLAVSSIEPHPSQPRRSFPEESLEELAASIRARGVIQPIVVRPRDGRFQIVAGERRWRAAQRAQLHDIPAIVRGFDDAETLEVAILENVQRQDLNAVEEAEGYRRLIDEFGHTQEELGRIVHKSRSHVANLLRLLDLPEQVLAMVASGGLSMGHARALLGAPDPVALAREVERDGLSVRETERLVRVGRAPRPTARPVAARAAPAPDADTEALERQLGDLLGLRVRISHHAGGGTVSIAYSTLDQLDMICQRLSGEKI